MYIKSDVIDFIQDILFKIKNWNKFDYVYYIEKCFREKNILKKNIIWYNFFVKI